MMAANISTVQEWEGFTYSHCFWGEGIYGSKEQLQALGIAEGMAFPGEPGGPKRTMSVLDPRGLKCRIEKQRIETDRYYAAIEFPGRNRPALPPPEAFAPGVFREAGIFPTDGYKGTGTALVAAGLIAAEHLPGQPGMNKISVTILADGRTPRISGRLCPGDRFITRLSGEKFELRICVTEEEQNRRAAVLDRIEDEFLRRMRALPRPAPLVAKRREAEAQQRRAAMRLVWSRP